MIIQAVPSGPFETNAYVVACPSTRLAAIIDPAPESSERLLKFLDTHELVADRILLTHSHWDHIAEAAELKERLNIPIWIHPADAPNLRDPGSDGLPLWIEIRGVEPDHDLQEGESISIGNLKFSVIHTPGHTPGGVCFYNKEEQILFSGDTLFKGSIGNISFPTSNAEAMWKSLEKLAVLPPETKVYPGHGPMTTIRRESWLGRAKEVFGQ